MKSIHIKNYKNLRDLKIDSLSKINLIVGENNVGKSTLLEAISIFASRGNIGSLSDILDVRGEVYDFSSSLEEEKIIEKRIISFLSLVSDRDMELFANEGIGIACDHINDSDISNEEVILKLLNSSQANDYFNNRYKQESLFSDFSLKSDNSKIEYGIYVRNNIKGNHIDAFYRLGGRIRQILPDKSSSTYSYEFVSNNQISRDRNPELFDKISLTPLDKEIITALKIIEPKIEGINFLSEELKNIDRRVPFIVLSSSAERLRLTSMGDGINRVLTIILALLNSKDGFLLIDEFENGLHYSVQVKLWEIIYTLSERLNVQVFATTHSKDCIKSFVESDRGNNGRLIRLENFDGEIISTVFKDKERLDFAIKNKIEVR